MTSSRASFEEALQNASELLVSDPAASLELAEKLVAQKPDARAFRLAAAALRALQRHEEAKQAELQGINVGFTEPLRRARSAQRSRRSSEASAIAQDYLRSNPGDLLAMTIAAEAAVGLNHANDAEPMLRQVVDRAPAFPPASMLLASVLAGQLRLREAAELLEQLLRRVPQEISAKRFLADLRAQMNDPTGAALLYDQILAAEPGNPADQFKYAQFLRAAGRKGESVAALRRMIALRPLSGNAWWTLAHYFPEELTEQDEAQIRAGLEARALRHSDRGFLQLAVSILDNRRGNRQAAFEAITSAQVLLSAGTSYDPASLTRHVDELIHAYTPGLFERLGSRGSNSDSPIFIVGMPRSGSTLLERILGQHSQVEAVGELPVIPRLVASGQADGTPAYRSLLPHSLTGDKLAEMANWYLERSNQYRHTDKPHFTDKYNGNWIRAGLIRLMFPKAKILDIRRNALDCCWAVFRSVLVGDYAHDQHSLGRYYADYVRLMDAMAAASPSHILTVRYEEIVADLESQTRHILDFLGLDFDPTCVDFHRSTAPVSTASSEQVRRPINRESVGSAEPYRRWLQPLIQELNLALGSPGAQA
jgi:tetratricopeptide (TPR) repeat protein